MQKRLVKKDKKIFGVCGGLGDYFDIDPTIVRIIFLASVLLVGTGVLLYIIMAIIMPDETTAG
jgi:phage shock protein C